MVQQHTNNSGESHRTFVVSLLNVSDVAAILGVSAKTVNKLERGKKLACVQVTSRDRRFFRVLRNKGEELASLCENNPIRVRWCDE